MTSSTHEVRSPGVVSVLFTNKNTRLTLELDDGRIISAPLAWYPRLRHGTPKERGTWQLIGGGVGVHWPVLDEDVSVENVLAGKPSFESDRSFQRWLDARTAKARR